jgi:hypothetical protein
MVGIKKEAEWSIVRGPWSKQLWDSRAWFKSASSSVVFRLQSGFDFIERVAECLNGVQDVIAIRFQNSQHHVGGSSCKTAGRNESLVR